MAGIGACPIGAVSVPPYAEEQVEWYPRNGGSDEIRVVVDRKVAFSEVSLSNLVDICAPGGSSHRVRSL